MEQTILTSSDPIITDDGSNESLPLPNKKRKRSISNCSGTTEILEDCTQHKKPKYSEDQDLSGLYEESNMEVVNTMFDVWMGRLINLSKSVGVLHRFTCCNCKEINFNTRFNHPFCCHEEAVVCSECFSNMEHDRRSIECPLCSKSHIFDRVPIK